MKEVKTLYQARNKPLEKRYWKLIIGTPKEDVVEGSGHVALVIVAIIAEAAHENAW